MTATLIGLCAAQSAVAQSLPKYSELMQQIVKLQDEVFEVKSKVFRALTSNNYTALVSGCEEFKKQDDLFLNNFYQIKSFAYFTTNNPKSYSEKYLSSAILTLADAMNSRQQGIFILCRSQPVGRFEAMSALSLLSNAYTTAQTSELWTEMSDQ